MNRSWGGVVQKPMIRLLVCATVWGWACSIHAESDARVPEPLTAGLRQVQAGRADLAIARWVQDGLAARDPAFQRTSGALAQTLADLGPFESWTVLQSTPLGEGVRLVALSGRFDRGTLFLRVLAFERNGREVVNRLAWSLDPVEVLPERVGMRRFP